MFYENDEEWILRLLMRWMRNRKTKIFVKFAAVDLDRTKDTPWTLLFSLTPPVHRWYMRRVLLGVLQWESSDTDGIYVPNYRIICENWRFSWTLNSASVYPNSNPPRMAAENWKQSCNVAIWGIWMTTEEGFITDIIMPLSACECFGLQLLRARGEMDRSFIVMKWWFSCLEVQSDRTKDHLYD